VYFREVADLKVGTTQDAKQNVGVSPSSRRRIVARNIRRKWRDPNAAFALGCGVEDCGGTVCCAPDVSRPAVCTQARVLRGQFRLLQGKELIKVYGKGEGAVKAFCSNCGSSLFGGDWPDGDQVSIRMGAFDDDPGIRPQFHTFVECRAPWDTITDDLPQYAERRA